MECGQDALVNHRVSKPRVFQMAKKKTSKKTTTKKTVARKVTKKASTKKKAAKKTTPKKSTKKKPPELPTIPAIAVSGDIPTVERPYLVERLLEPDEVRLEYSLRRDELMEKFWRAENALREWKSELYEKKIWKENHITGCYVTYRRRFGHIVSPLQVVIAINVSTKYREDELEELEMEVLPRSIDGVPVKILEGKFKQSVSPTNPLPFSEALIGGAPVAPTGNPGAFGTLGIVVKEQSGDLKAITNEHIASTGTDVDQLGPSGTAQAIGTVSVSRPVPGARQSTVDCAAIPVVESPTSQITADSVRNLTHTLNPPLSSRGIDLYYAGRALNVDDTQLKVVKFGAASGRTLEGMIQGHATSDEVFVNGVLYKNIIRFEGGNSFQIPGDSGAVALIKTKVNNKRAFVVAGLFFAEIDSNTVGIACHFVDVVLALGLTISPNEIVSNWSTRKSDSEWDI